MYAWLEKDNGVHVFVDTCVRGSLWTLVVRISPGANRGKKDVQVRVCMGMRMWVPWWRCGQHSPEVSGSSPTMGTMSSHKLILTL